MIRLEMKHYKSTKYMWAVVGWLVCLHLAFCEGVSAQSSSRPSGVHNMFYRCYKCH
jgi:hypothetical protein